MCIHFSKFCKVYIHIFSILLIPAHTFFLRIHSTAVRCCAAGQVCLRRARANFTASFGRVTLQKQC